LADGAELSAYRVVQESLTNALRHAGPNVTARVSIAYGENTLDVSITDDGRGSSSRNDNDGHGIIGMRERVTMLGGEFDAGPKQGGGFKVHATIPLEK
jgi:signal transduction histidine kinase